MKKPIDDIISNYVRNDYPEEIDRSFRSWLVDQRHTPEKDQALRQLWDETNPQTIDRLEESTARMEQLTGIADRRRLALVTKRLRRWRLSAAAAVIIACVACAGLFISRQNAIDSSTNLLQAYIPKAEMQTITLPDGTTATLNANSTLLYPQSFDGSSRSVFLSGQACFSVAHDPEHPFIVKTNDLQVIALGTEFVVAAYPDEKEITTTLIKGKVKVDYDNLSKSQILAPGQQLAYNTSTRKATLNTDADIDDATAWQRGETIMRSLTADEIFNRLSRRFNVKFTYNPDSFPDDRYTLTFRPDADIDEVMDIVSKVMGNMTYTIDGDNCRIEPHR